MSPELPPVCSAILAQPGYLLPDSDSGCQLAAARLLARFAALEALAAFLRAGFGSRELLRLSSLLAGLLKHESPRSAQALLAFGYYLLFFPPGLGPVAERCRAIQSSHFSLEIKLILADSTGLLHWAGSFYFSYSFCPSFLSAAVVGFTGPNLPLP